MNRETFSLAQLADIFSDVSVRRGNAHVHVRVPEDSLQEEFLRRVQMRARHGASRFVKENQTISAAAVPQYEFYFASESLKNSPHEDAQKLAWVLENKLSDAPYVFPPH